MNLTPVNLLTRYDLARFPFPTLVSQHLGVADLTNLHVEGPDYPQVFAREEDQSTVFHTRLYGLPEHAAFMATYRAFLGWLGPRLLGIDHFVYQAVPTFRVHLPGNVSVGERHCDAKYGHPDHEVTCWVPLTWFGPTAGLWMEGPGGEEAPQVCPGEVLLFDGRNRTHWNRVNETGRTRVSFDARIIRWSEYEPDAAARSSGRGLRFVVGEYFAEMRG
jgi:hypothetical protein